jgi:hypothetical protein
VTIGKPRRQHRESDSSETCSLNVGEGYFSAWFNGLWADEIRRRQNCSRLSPELQRKAVEARQDGVVGEDPKTGQRAGQRTRPISSAKTPKRRRPCFQSSIHQLLDTMEQLCSRPCLTYFRSLPSGAWRRLRPNCAYHESRLPRARSTPRLLRHFLHY